jgi:hypothetical protein
VSTTTTHKEGLVVGARLMPGNPYDRHTSAEALEQAAILSDVKPKIPIVDRGYKSVAIDGVTVYQNERALLVSWHPFPPQAAPVAPSRHALRL